MHLCFIYFFNVISKINDNFNKYPLWKRGGHINTFTEKNIGNSFLRKGR